MLAHYLALGWRSLKASPGLTGLMILSLALGIGACMTSLTVLHLLSGNPVPDKSDRLFYVQVDPTPSDGGAGGHVNPPGMMSYRDAMNLMRAHEATHQAIVALTPSKITPAIDGLHPFLTEGVMTTSAFFTMFEAKFKYGGSWADADDDDGANVAVISDALNERLFGGANSIGKVLRVNGRDLQVVGVLDHWSPQPRFYAIGLSRHNYGDGDSLFSPLSSNLNAGAIPENVSCYGDGDLSNLRTAPCLFLGMWVEVSAADRAAYEAYVANYVADQVSSGRFQRRDWSLTDIRTWLRDKHVVPDDVRLQVNLAFGFLIICIANTAGLLLAKYLRRSREIAVRRALGARRTAVFAQLVIEGGVVGLTGGLLGLGVAQLGLVGIRRLPVDYANLAHLDLSMLALTFFIAIVAGLAAGIFPAWRGCSVAPASMLKAS